MDKAFRTFGLSTSFLVLACCSQGATDGEKNSSAPVSAGPTAESVWASSGASASASAAATGSAVAQGPVKHSENCAAGMLEVKGSYCTGLMHRCMKGGKTKDFQKTDSSDPYYCEEYQEGYAKCVGKEEPKHFCMDEYEWPNQKGAIPVVMVSWYDAKKQCEGQGKRLCGDDEWTLACEGPERTPYTYGWKRDATACNIDKPWRKPNDGLLSQKDASPEVINAEIDRLSQRVPSGTFPRCISAFGVMDMGGNVDEWAVNVTLHGKPFQSTFKGGHWCGGARNRCRPQTESHDETTAYYAEGFRCCANVKAGK